MSQQNKSQAQVAALEAKIAEQQLHIEVLASNMFAQKQRADKLQQELNELDELISPDDDMHTPSGRVDYGLLTVPAFRTRFFNRPLTPAEAEVIESEMGRIELAAETENARQAAEQEQPSGRRQKPYINSGDDSDAGNCNGARQMACGPVKVLFGFGVDGVVREFVKVFSHIQYGETDGDKADQKENGVDNLADAKEVRAGPDDQGSSDQRDGFRAEHAFDDGGGVGRHQWERAGESLPDLFLGCHLRNGFTHAGPLLSNE